MLPATSLKPNTEKQLAVKIAGRNSAGRIFSYRIDFYHSAFINTSCSRRHWFNNFFFLLFSLVSISITFCRPDPIPSRLFFVQTEICQRPRPPNPSSFCKQTPQHRVLSADDNMFNHVWFTDP